MSQKRDDHGKSFRESFRVFGAVSTIGFFFTVAIMIGMYGGNCLDVLLGTTPVFLIAGAGFGIAAGFLELKKIINRFN